MDARTRNRLRALASAFFLTTIAMIGGGRPLYAQVTATWAGGGGNNSYSNPANWDINVVPVNGGGNTYNVIIPAGVSVVFDVDDPAEVTDFSLASGANFTVPGGHSLTVLDDAVVAGIVTASSTGALFQATGAGTAFGAGGGRAHATSQGQVRIAATSYTNSTTGTVTLLSATGAGSLLDLSSLQSFVDTTSASAATRTVLASNSGVIDLSNLGTINKTGQAPLRFRVESGGDIQLDSLMTVSGTVLLDIANGSSLTANALISFTNGSIQFDGNNPGTFQAGSLTDFSGSSISLAPGQEFHVSPGGLTTINSSQFHVRGGKQFGGSQIAATSYANSTTGTVTLLSATGAGSLLDLSSLQSFVDTTSASAATRTVLASNNGVIDFSNVGTINKTGQAPLRFRAESGGELLFGNFNVTGNVQIEADGSESAIQLAGSAQLSSPSSVALTALASMNVGGDLLYNYTNPVSWNLDTGILSFTGLGRHFLEVGGEDLGVNGSSSGNFGIGQLVVGADLESSVVTLVDVFNNGAGLETEALYLYGLGGPDGLRVLGGSTLVIGNINTYAFLDGEMVWLNSLFPAGVTTIPFDHGFLAVPEPSSAVLAIVGCALLLWRRKRK